MRVKLKKIIKLFLPILIILGCSKPNKYTHFSGEIKGLSKGIVYLKKADSSQVTVIDSVFLKATNTFNFDLNIIEPDVYYLHLDKKDGVEFNDYMEVFLEPSKAINLYTSLNKFNKEVIVTGSENHELYAIFKKNNNNFNKQRFGLLKANIEAVKNKHQDSIALTYNQLQKNLKYKYLYAVNFAKTHSNYEVAPYVLVRECKDVNVKYLDTVYQSLGNHIKVSKYGKQLKRLIAGKKHKK